MSLAVARTIPEIVAELLTTSLDQRQLALLCELTALVNATPAQPVRSKHAEAQAKYAAKMRLISSDQKNDQNPDQEMISNDQIPDQSRAEPLFLSSSVTQERKKERKKPSVLRESPTYSGEFDAFWKAYPRTPVMSKKETWTQWAWLSPDDQAAAGRAVRLYVDFLKSKPDHPAVHACRFLSQRRFDGFTASASAVQPIPPDIPQELHDDWRDGWRPGMPLSPPARQKPAVVAWYGEWNARNRRQDARETAERHGAAVLPFGQRLSGPEPGPAVVRTETRQ